MNVFVIPSWYPDLERGLLGGVFVQEAVSALARHHPEIRLHVSRWGQGHRELSLDRLRTWLAGPAAVNAALPAPPNVVEHCSPTWTWRYGVGRGNLAGVVRANRTNLARARAIDTVHLLHAHVAFPGGTVAQRLSQETGIPYIVTEHMSPFPFRFLERHGELVPDVREPLRHATRVTAVSRALAEQIRVRTGADPTVIPNGVDETYFTLAPPSPRDGVTFTFFTVARLEPQKGIADLLRAIARLDIPGVRFRIAGGGSLAGELRALAASLGLAARVTWLGPLSRERVRDEMRSCDAFVLASRHESFGIVYVEALACGKPVVATRCEGPEDIVNDANGVLVPVGDAPALAAALAGFARRERAWDAAAIRADFEARFSSRVVAGRFAALYRDVAGTA